MYNIFGLLYGHKLRIAALSAVKEGSVSRMKWFDTLVATLPTQ